MKEFYYFSYETPHQRKNNREHGFDDQDSFGFIIEADSREKIIEWGNQLADKFLQTLYQDSDITISKMGFNYGYIYTLDQSKKPNWEIREVKFEETPDMAKIIKNRYPNIFLQSYET